GLVGAVVNYVLGPKLAWRQEETRRDRAARTRLAAAVQSLKHRFEQEKVVRLYLGRGGTIGRRERISPSELQRLLWPIARALADPDLLPGARNSAATLLIRMGGSSTLRYLATCDSESTIGEGHADLAMALEEGIVAEGRDVVRLAEEGTVQR
ncbi:MAG TPA: hypothetical protein VGX75_04945, partial [bacterium]|nr:hypothetical protein [bacterium]